MQYGRTVTPPSSPAPAPLRIVNQLQGSRLALAADGKDLEGVGEGRPNSPAPLIQCTCAQRCPKHQRVRSNESPAPPPPPEVRGGKTKAGRESQDLEHLPAAAAETASAQWALPAGTSASEPSAEVKASLARVRLQMTTKTAMSTFGIRCTEYFGCRCSCCRYCC